MASEAETITRYAVIMDAGSSGTRVYVYQWEVKSDDNPGSPALPEKIVLPNGWGDNEESDKKMKVGSGEIKGIHELAPRVPTRPYVDINGDNDLGIDEEIATTIAGVIDKLSAGKKDDPTVKEIFKEVADGVRDYLAPLFNYADKFLEEVERSSVPFFLLATAGMRRLKQTNYEGYIILRNAITDHINGKGFKDPVYDTISGDCEGLYGWIAVNHAERRFQTKQVPHGFMEMGGESAQIAFCPSSNNCINYHGILTRVQVGEKGYDVFSKTWLGLGANAAWKSYEKALRDKEENLVHDPCLPKGYSYKLNDSRKIIVGTGGFDECLAETHLLLGCKDGCTINESCVSKGKAGCLLQDAPGLGFGGAEQCQFFGASVFWHATHGIFGSNDPLGKKTYDMNAFTKEVTELYAKSWTDIKTERPKEEANKYQHLLKAFFKAGLIINTLHRGFGVPVSSKELEASLNAEAAILLSIPIFGIGLSIAAGLAGMTVPELITSMKGRNKAFDTLESVTWTLGRVVLCAINSEPQTLTRDGWMKPAEKSETVASSS